MHPRIRAGARSPDRGSVTAEAALALPALLLVLAAVLWAVASGIGHLRCLDAARTGARALARGEEPAAARAAALASAPAEASVLLRNRGQVVEVEVRAVVRPRGPVLGRLPGLPVGAQVAAYREQR